MRFILKSFFVLSLLICQGCAKKEDTKEKDKAAALPEMAMGSLQAPITVISYSSLTCKHCAEFHTETLPKIEEKYIKPGLVRIVFRDYPGDQISLMAHQLAWCKGQLKYFDLVKTLFSTQEEWLSAKDPKAALKTVLIKNGMSGDQVDACLKNQALLDQIIQERLEGQKKYKITATPTLVINTKIYPEALPFEQFKEAIDPLLSLKKAKNKAEAKKEAATEEKSSPEKINPKEKGKAIEGKKVDTEKKS